MTYFHRRTSTIIGAKAFHDPVRDGKGWGHLAMVVKRNRVLIMHQVGACSTNLGRSHNGAVYLVCALAVSPGARGVRAAMGACGLATRLVGNCILRTAFCLNGTCYATTCKVIGSSRTGN